MATGDLDDDNAKELFFEEWRFGWWSERAFYNIIIPIVTIMNSIADSISNLKHTNTCIFAIIFSSRLHLHVVVKSPGGPKWPIGKSKEFFNLESSNTCESIKSYLNNTLFPKL